MNLTEALNVALPDIPAQTWKGRHPRLHPKLIHREHVQPDGSTLITATISGTTWMYRFAPLEWQVVQLFDGKRSYAEVAELSAELTGVPMTEEEVREMASTLDSMEFWYKTPFEENVAGQQKLAAKRQERKKKSRYGDISKMHFSAWDPDSLLDRILPYIRFMFSRWFTVVTLLAYCFMAYVFVTRWEEIGHDTFAFFDFSQKGFRDILQFWALACAVLFIHELAHGLASKYYGGHVHHMGFQLIYLTPAFFTDVAEAWVLATKWQRIVCVLAGVWSEMIVCAIATAVWWGTPTGNWIHDASYQLILITGLGAIFINWNPLVKLDGYFLLTEFLGMPELKEESTAYVAAWVKRHVWRLPVEVPFVPRRRRLGYVVYAVLSGMYSYSLLWFVAKFAGNIASGWWPAWGFLVTLLVAFLIFRGRIRALRNFIKTLYLDKEEKLMQWLTPRKRVVLAVLGFILLVAPIWRETIEGRFIMEPASRTVLRAAVPGTVVDVAVSEGETVTAGQPLLRLRNLEVESEAARAVADARLATARSTEAQLRYADFGRAQIERQQLQQASSLAADRATRLNVVAPIAGTVVTPRVRDRLGHYISEGEDLIEIADLSTMKARIFLPEFEMRKARPGAAVLLLTDSSFGSLRGTVAAIAPVKQEITPGLIEASRYKGSRPPNFFAATVELSNDGSLRYGLTGTAQVVVQRRSIAGMALRPIWEFVGRKIW